MTRMIKLIVVTIVAIALSISALAQQQNTILVADLVTNSAVTGATSTVSTIGQGQHLFQFRFSNAPAQSCVAHAVSLYAEGSFNNSTWTRLRSANSGSISFIYPDADGILQTNLLVFGAFPYVRANVASFDTVKCRITVNYSGTLYPTTNDNNLFVNQNGLLSNVAVAPTTSANVNNLGQLEHKFTVRLKSAPAQVCPGTIGLTYAVLVSDDGNSYYVATSYESSGLEASGSQYVATREVKAQGGYNFVKFAILTMDTVQCRIDVNYVGLGTPISVNPANRTNWIGGEVNVAGTSTIISAVTFRTCIYGMTIYNESAAQTLTISDGAGTVLWQMRGMPAGFSQIWPLTPTSPYFCTGFNGTTAGSLRVGITANTYVSIGVNYQSFTQ